MFQIAAILSHIKPGHQTKFHNKNYRSRLLNSTTLNELNDP